VDGELDEAQREEPAEPRNAAALSARPFDTHADFLADLSARWFAVRSLQSSFTGGRGRGSGSSGARAAR
jgi:hypothetical protein